MSLGCRDVASAEHAAVGTSALLELVPSPSAPASPHGRRCDAVALTAASPDISVLSSCHDGSGGGARRAFRVRPPYPSRSSRARFDRWPGRLIGNANAALYGDSERLRGAPTQRRNDDSDPRLGIGPMKNGNLERRRRPVTQNVDGGLREGTLTRKTDSERRFMRGKENSFRFMSFLCVRNSVSGLGVGLTDQ